MTSDRMGERILILAPVGQDAPSMAAVLQAHEFAPHVCETPLDACEELPKGAAALLLTDEALACPRIPDLMQALGAQPAWSELPLIVLTRGGESRWIRLLNLLAEAAGSMTVLERPIGEATLVRSVEVALRSRRRQYQVRDLLEAQRAAHEKVRDSEEKYRTVAERLRLAMTGAQMGAWEIDLRTGRVVWDARQHSIFGLPPSSGPETMDGFFALVHPDDVDRIKRATADAEVSTQFSDEFRIVRPDGEVRWIAGHGVTVTDAAGRPARMVGVNYDITDRKAAHARLEQFAVELEREVAERTQELVSSQEQLRALATELNLTEQRERKRLAAELHDHLAQLLVLVRLKLSQAKQGPVVRSLEMLEQAEEVVNECLKYTRNLVAELSPPVLHQFGLFAALRWLGEQMQRYHLQVTVRTDVTEDLRLPDEQAVLLFQSVRELLINAAKHAVSKQASIVSEERDGCLRIVVEDHGVGFDLLAMATQKTVSQSSKFGLFSIRERMHAMGGRLELRSSPGTGTRATLILPLAADRERAAEAPTWDEGTPASARSGPQKKALGQGPCRVLIADDHVMVRQGLRSVLESFTDIVVVGEAANGAEAVELCDQLKPTVVVMDINMPVMSGIEATARIKTRHPDVIVIGLSVNASGENQDAMRTAGATRLLTKEAAVEHLYGAIQGALKGMETSDACR